MTTPAFAGDSTRALLAALERSLDNTAPGFLLVGEQHDADEHQRLHRLVVETLSARQQVSAVVIEMVDRGRSTAGLAPDTPESAVRGALGWREPAWPWQRYGPVVMASVRAGVPVLGGNLPRADMPEAMRDARWDTLWPRSAWQRLQQTIDEAHCGLMPRSQLPAMARIQLARDDAMARTLAQAAGPGRLAVLFTGQVHADRQWGVPWHLERLGHLPASTRVILLHTGPTAPDDLQADHFVATPALAPKDHCAELRQGQ